jgi:fatty acid desaturase
MNYHTEHHMYAAVPFFNLAKFRRAIRGDMRIPQRSFLANIGLLRRDGHSAPPSEWAL